MPYDTELADRVRAVLPMRDDVSEKAMFGGLAFLIGGNMAVAVGSRGALMIRSTAEQVPAIVAEHASAQQTVMRGRPMTGWLDVSADGLDDADALQFWVDLGVEAASALPPK